MEQIPEPEGPWRSRARAGPPDPAPRRLPGPTFLVWLGVIASAAVLQGVRSAADGARAAGRAGSGRARDVAAFAAAVALVVITRRVFRTNAGAQGSPPR